MNRGELKGLIEAVQHGDEVNQSQIDSELKLSLISSIAKGALRGESWASVAVKSRSDSHTEVSEGLGRIVRLSGFVQEEGFQTDEAQREQDGYHFHQLTVFWGNGKDTYEAERRLGTFNPDLLDTAA